MSDDPRSHPQLPLFQLDRPSPVTSQELALASHEALERAAIRPPAMVTVHCMGEHRGTPYLVMERILGMSLAMHLAQRRALGQPFALDEAIDVLAALADGLEALHRAGFSHRDLKP